MIGKQYRAHKTNIIDLFSSYKEARGSLHDGIDIEFLEGRLNRLKNGKYTLAVAGEVNSGKSTFINALLGIELLPTDVLQATSAIIEIFKSEKPFLSVKYSDGRVEEADLSSPDIEAARQKLKGICSLFDEYRDIPTTLIDKYIASIDGPLELTPLLIAELGKRSEMDLTGKEGVISRYIDSRSKGNIPSEISLGYPLKWTFDELRIVDSPGVNAIGGVQELSFNYLEDANAILFVHPIKPVESKSLRNFVSSTISNKSKESLFLILTHAAYYSNAEIDRLHADAVRMYRQIIPEQRILAVDSVLKLIHNDLENGDMLAMIERSSEQKAILLPRFERDATTKNKELKDVCLEYSRFAPMFEAIDTFSMQAPYLQLQEILESMKAGYEKLDSLHTDTIALKEKKTQSPQSFAAEIHRIESALTHYRNLMLKTVELAKIEYSGKHAKWKEGIKDLKAKYPEHITNSDNVEQARKHFVDGRDEIESRINSFSESLTSYLSSQLHAIGNTFRSEHKHITLPEVDLKSIEDRAKSEAFTEVDKYEDQTRTGVERRWYTLWLYEHKFEYTVRVKTGTEQVLDEEKHLSIVKNQYCEMFFILVNELSSRSAKVRDEYLTVFTSEMEGIIADRQRALQEELTKQQTNDQILAEIELHKTKKKFIHEELLRLEEILEEVKCMKR